MIGMQYRDPRFGRMQTAFGRHAGVLWRNGFVSVEQVRAYPDYELYTLRGIGVQKASAIRTLVQRDAAWGAILAGGGP